MEMLLLIGMLAAGQTGVPADVQKASDKAIVQLIKNIEANERLYDNLDVEVTRRYRFLQDKPVLPETVIRKDGTLTYVSQGTMFRIDRNEIESSAKSKISDTTRQSVSYDGEVTRRVQVTEPQTDPSINRKRANIVAARGNAYAPFSPHLELIPRHSLAAPLSVWLTGGEVLANHPEASNEQKEKKRVTKFILEGSETVDGLECVKLRCDIWDPSRNVVNTRRVLWIAKDRNFIPIKSVGYLPRCSEDYPISEARAFEFKEVEPGVWLPMKYHRTIYSDYDLMKEKKHIKSNVEDWEVKRVSLHPNYGKEFFSRVDIPPGTLVAEVVNNKVVKQYRTEPAPPAPHWVTDWRWWLLALIVGIVAMLTWRRWRNA